MLGAFADKAVTSTLHRLHLLPMFDCIYILRDGAIVDEGSFIELRQRSVIFQGDMASPGRHSQPGR